MLLVIFCFLFCFIYLILGAIIAVGTYSEALLRNSNISENSGGFLKASQRCTFEVSQTIFSKSELKDEAKLFSISLLGQGFISNCSFMSISGEKDGFFITIFNTLKMLNIDVFISLN